MFSTCRSRPFIRFPSVRHLSPWFHPSMRSGLTAKKIRPIGLWKALRHPSYICAGTSVPKDALFAVIEKLRGPRFSHFYTTNGCLYSCAPADPLPDLSFLEGSRTNRGLLVPSESFLNSLPAETFYKMYHRVFPAGS